MLDKLKRVPLFWKIYIVIVGIILIGIAVVWNILWSFLKCYEQSRVEYVMDDIVVNFEKADEDFIKGYVMSNESKIDDEQAISAAVSDYIKELCGGEWTFTKKSGEYSKERPAYALKKDGEKTGIVVYLKLLEERGKYNTPKWEVENITGMECLGQNYTITVPAGSKVLVNEKELGSELITSSQEATVLSNVTKYIDPPKTETYTLEHVYSNIEVKSTGPVYGKLLTLVSDEENNMEFGFEVSDELIADREETIKTISRNYALYVTNDLKFSSISSYILGGSAAYSFLSYVSQTNIWIDSHSKPEITNMKVYNYQSYTEDCFSCEVTFDETFDSYVASNHYEFPTHLKYVFVKRSGKWYVADIVILKNE